MKWDMDLLGIESCGVLFLHVAMCQVMIGQFLDLSSLIRSQA